MPTHKQRMSQLGKLVVPREGTEGREYFERWAESVQKDPQIEKQMKKRFKQACTVIYAQDDNGAGLQVDTELRFFLREFNARNFEHGLDSLPASFNVMEAFFNYTPGYAFFKLRKEHDHLLSFSEFLDYATSGGDEQDLASIPNFIEEGVIYSYNFTGDPAELTFSMADNEEFGFAGVSFVLHENEISMLLLAGQRTNTSSKSRELRDLGEGVVVPGKEMLKPADDREREATALMGNKEFWQTLALTRFDLEDKTQSVRYVLKDAGDAFKIITDDIGILIGPDGEFLDAMAEELAKTLPKRTDNYRTLFEICKTALHLPFFFEEYGDQVTEERHPTALHQKKKTVRSFLREKHLTAGERITFRTVSVLRTDVKASPDSTTFLAPDFKLDVSGFWKKLKPDQVGTDKHGREIHGRTWVKKTLTWLESSDRPIPVRASKAAETLPRASAGPDVGYIYVMRSAAHPKDVFKIGLTRRSAEIRSDELSRSTSSPDKFLVAQEWNVPDCSRAEKLIHDRLSGYRLNPGREFFQAPYREIVKVIDSVVTELEST